MVYKSLYSEKKPWLVTSDIWEFPRLWQSRTERAVSAVFLCRKAAPGDVWLFPSLVASSLLFSLTAASWFSDLLWKCSGKQEQPPPGGMSPSVLVDGSGWPCSQLCLWVSQDQEQRPVPLQMPMMVSGPFPRQEALQPRPLSRACPVPPYPLWPRTALGTLPGSGSLTWVDTALCSSRSQWVLSAVPAAFSKCCQPCVVPLDPCSASRFCCLDPVTLPASFQMPHPAGHLVPCPSSSSCLSHLPSRLHCFSCFPWLCLFLPATKLCDLILSGFAHIVIPAGV